MAMFMFFYIYSSISVSCFDLNFFSIGMSRASSPLLFDVQSYGSPGRHQAPVVSLPIGEEILQQTSAIRDWVFYKISLPIVWLTASWGLPSFEARKKVGGDDTPE